MDGIDTPVGVDPELPLLQPLRGRVLLQRLPAGLVLLAIGSYGHNDEKEKDDRVSGDCFHHGPPWYSKYSEHLES
jgi:hypothetical protein